MKIMTESENNIETTTEAVEETTPDVSTPEETTAEASPEAAPEALDEGEEPQTRKGMNWFVLRVASNKEDYVKAALDRKVEIEAMQHLVGRIMVPTEKTQTLSKTLRLRQELPALACWHLC